MKTDAILKADVLDIIFENRNKSYGAYALRKFYNNRLYKALGLMLGFVIILSSFTMFKGKTKIGLNFISDSGFTIKTVSLNEKKPVAPKVNTPPASVTPKKPVLTDMHTSIVITKSPVTNPIKDLRDGAVIGTRDIDVPSGGGSTKVIPVISGGGGVDTLAVVVLTKPIDKITPSDFAEVMPTYPGGMDALRKYLERNLQNPEEVEDGQTVSVKVRFVVGYDGALKNLEIVEDGGASFNNEVLRVVKKMKPWNPGKTKGENVSVYYTIPIKFTTTE
jgi:periplasmic protein TonB